MHIYVSKSLKEKKILTKRARSCILGFLLPKRFLSIFKASFACLQISTKFKSKIKKTAIFL